MKKIFLVFICLFFITNVKAEEIKLADNAKSAILIEASTGEILFEKNSHEKLHPASMTKMMSMLLIMESIEKGSIKWEDEVVVSPNASSMGGSQILLETGEKMSVSDLFKGIAVASGNDAVVALAEKVAGTEEGFVILMNKRAKELGLKDTHFVNCHGIDETDHYSSAYDMSLIAKELSRHEEVFKYSSIYEDYLRKDTYRKFWLVNTNKLVRFYNGADGLKTGYTNLAGYCLTATAKREGMRLIAVVMGEEDNNVRNTEASKMLDYGFANYGLIDVLSKNTVIDNVKVLKGKVDNVDIIPLESVTVLYKKTNEKPNIEYKLDIKELESPLRNGDIVGKLRINKDNNYFKTINVTVKENIEKTNIFEQYIKNMKKIFE